ncbi:MULTISPECIES: hypothetical protein [spotted fever group]|uniref:hypothetical protein n=1 Tax=spotted fever group TaxID=114277 RepID=UPI0002F3AA1B|nr:MULTISPECIES: hypothetical protein [spotted fever group]USD85060.1 hypothetical protein NDY50_04890 [Rickettsia rickettsii]USD86383.1 hypothetical protein NDY48_04805 [Rickettsia rickettsii]USD87698.1 hypothetical protein NDY49_04850 [Rickettsia rickettsii]WGQ95115.1 hypothetical protein QBX69_04895 [Rickettsia rickettsii str. 'Sheila Smith']
MDDTNSSLRGKTVSFDEAISGILYYFMRLPRLCYASPRNDGKTILKLNSKEAKIYDTKF